MQAKKAELRGLYKLFPASYDIQRGIEHVERQLRQGGLSLREEKAMVSSIPRLKSLQRLQEQFATASQQLWAQRQLFWSEVDLSQTTLEADLCVQGTDPKNFLEQFNDFIERASFGLPRRPGHDLRDLDLSSDEHDLLDRGPCLEDVLEACPRMEWRFQGLAEAPMQGFGRLPPTADGAMG